MEFGDTAAEDGIPSPAPRAREFPLVGTCPGPRCGHTLTAIAGPDEEWTNAKLVLFGGATALEGQSKAGDPPSSPGPGGGGIRLAGATNDIHILDVRTGSWTQCHATGDPPSPRAAHSAAAVGNMVVIQGGIGPLGLAAEDLHVLDLTDFAHPRWHRVAVAGAGPSARYAHCLALVANRFLVALGGNDGRATLGDAWALDTSEKPYAWRAIEAAGDPPAARMYATACARSDGLLLLCGGRGVEGASLGDAHGLARHRDGRWEWAAAPGAMPVARYQHGAVFVDARLHVLGGAVGGGRMVEEAEASAALDTAAGRWVAGAPEGGGEGGPMAGVMAQDAQATGGGEAEVARRSSAGENGGASAPSAPAALLRRCRHAMAAVGSHIFVHGGLRGSALLEDMLVAEDGPGSWEGVDPSAGPWRAWIRADRGEAGLQSLVAAAAEEAAAAAAIAMRRVGAAEDLRALGGGGAGAGAAEAAGQGAGAGEAASSPEETASVARTSPSLSLARQRGEFPASRDMPTPTVRLYHRAVVVAQEVQGALRGLVRQLSLDQFENEGRRVGGFESPSARDAQSPSSGARGSAGRAWASPLLERAESAGPRGVHRAVLQQLLQPRLWRPPEAREFAFGYEAIAELCEQAEAVFREEPTLLRLGAPVKIFGDLHGQFGDLMRLFEEYGTPSTSGDITYIDYLFLGDYVDRGAHSLETICLLLALKIEHPSTVHLIRGNHEASDINALFGFRLECLERLGDVAGLRAWTRINQLFNWLPLAAVIEDRVLCMHGGIGRSIQSMEQIAELQRPLVMEDGGIVLMDLLWSDPTTNDAVEGVQPSPRGPGLVTFGPDRVMQFCADNDLQMIVRAHECVMDGFERFAQGHLITLFSATNYCGTANNAGAILVLGRDLVMVPKLIHPLPPATPRTPGSPRDIEEDPPTPHPSAGDTWMQAINEERPPTPPRSRAAGPLMSFVD